MPLLLHACLGKLLKDCRYQLRQMLVAVFLPVDK